VLSNTLMTREHHTLFRIFWSHIIDFCVNSTEAFKYFLINVVTIHSFIIIQKEQKLYYK